MPERGENKNIKVASPPGLAFQPTSVGVPTTSSNSVLERDDGVKRKYSCRDIRLTEWCKESLTEHKNITIDIIKQVTQILEKPVITIHELQPTNRGGIVESIKIVVSSYGKDKAKGFIESSCLVYIDPNKNRTESWLQSVGLQLPSVTTAFGSIGRISYQDGKVKMRT